MEKTNEELISEGVCVSDRGVDHCVYCVDRCEASHFRRAIQELKNIAEDIKPDPTKE